MYTKFLIVASAFLFLICNANAQSVREVSKLTADDSVAQENFGTAIDIDNNLVAIGARSDDDQGFSSGSAYVFDVETGMQVSKLLPRVGSAFDNFGQSIALSNNVVAVGCPNDDEGGENSGSVYLFDAMTGIELRKLQADGGQGQAYFGFSVASQSGLVVVGAMRDSVLGTNAGAAYIFDAATGTQIARLSAPDAESGDLFGFSVVIDNGLIAVGAPSKNEIGTNSGAVYLFDMTGEYITKIAPINGQPLAKFGKSLDIDDNLLVVGSTRFTTPESNAGSVYVFDITTYQLVFQLFPRPTTGFISFGIDVAIDNGFIAVGANYSVGFNSAYAYVFDVTTGEWIVRLEQSDYIGTGRFGYDIDIQGEVVLVGDFQDDQAGTNSGAVYLYDFICESDLTGDYRLDFFDVSEFLNAFASNDPVADFHADGIFNYFDVSEFVLNFLAGCP